MERKTILTDYIKNEVMRNHNANINGDDDLVNSGVLDSLGILQLVTYIEENFGISIPDEDVVYENFKSVNALSGYLKQLELKNSE